MHFFLGGPEVCGSPSKSAGCPDLCRSVGIRPCPAWTSWVTLVYLSPGHPISKIEVTQTSLLALMRWWAQPWVPLFLAGSPIPLACPFSSLLGGLCCGRRRGGDEPMGCGPRVWMVASSAGSLLFNIKSRARNCIKMCIIIPEEGRAQPLVIAGLL